MVYIRCEVDYYAADGQEEKTYEEKSNIAIKYLCYWDTPCGRFMFLNSEHSWWYLSHINIIEQQHFLHIMILLVVIKSI